MILKIAAGSVFLLLLAGCGGGGSGGGGDITAKKVVLTEENANEAIGLGLVLDEFVGEFVGFAEPTGTLAWTESSRSASSLETRTESRQKRADDGVLERFSRKMALPQLDDSYVRSSSSSQPCPGGGSVTITETKITYDQCTDRWDAGWEKLHGTISVNEASLDGYSTAFRIAMDLKYNYEEIGYGEKYTEELTQKGSMTIGSNSDAAKIAGFNLDVTAKFNYAGEKWNGRLWVRNFNSTSETSGTTEVVKYKGTIGVESSDMKLKGSLDIATDSQLNYDHSDYSPQFPRGQAVKTVGANGSVLRVEFSNDGGLATVSLDGKEIRWFGSWSEYEDWGYGSYY